MINWKVRFKNPVWLAQIVLAIFAPVMAYAGLTAQDLTTWGAVIDLLREAVTNPYVLGLVVLSVWNAINDPTTKGFSDSKQAMTYNNPKEDKK
jgi:phi LC3 family holin